MPFSIDSSQTRFNNFVQAFASQMSCALVLNLVIPLYFQRNNFQWKMIACKFNKIKWELLSVGGYFGDTNLYS